MDKYQKYLESLRSSNPDLFIPENRAMLMQNVSEKFSIDFDDESFLAFTSARGFDLGEKKKTVENESLELPSISEPPTSSSDLSASQKRINHIGKLRKQETNRIGDSLYKDINSDFLSRSETDVKRGLSKILLGKGFNVRETNIVGNEIEVTAPNGNAIKVPLGVGAIDKVTDRVSESWNYSPMGLSFSIANTIVGAIKNKSSEEDLFFLDQSKRLRDFLKENTQNLTYNYQNRFESNPEETVKQLRGDLMDSNEYVVFSKNKTGDEVYSTQSKIRSLENQLSENPENDALKEELEKARLDLKSLLKESDRSDTVSSTDISNINKNIKSLREKISELNYIPSSSPGGVTAEVIEQRKQDTVKKKQLEEELKLLENTRTRFLELKDTVSTTISDLIKNNGGVSAFSDKQMYTFVSEGLDLRDVRLPSIKIGGVEASFNELYEFLTDETLRKSVVDGETSLEIIQGDSDNMFFGEIMKQAVELEKRQMDGSYLETIGLDLAASSMEVLDNVNTTLVDFNMMLSTPLTKQVSGLSDEDFDTVAESYFSTRHSKLREWARDARSKSMITDGDILSSESMAEYLFKGARAAAESLPITLTYLVTPEVGLALTGLSSYGGSLNEMNDIRDYVKQTGDPDGIYNNYGDLTLARARGISASKALVETGLTYAFTYNFLKGIHKSASRVGSQSYLESRKMVDFYSKSFANKAFNVSSKSLMTELPEESLIRAGQMALDEMYGIRDYSFKDYVREIGNTMLTTKFTALPLSAVSYNKMNKASKDVVHQSLANIALTDDIIQMRQELRDLDAEIEGIGRDKVDQSIIDERNNLAEKIVKDHQNRVDAIKDNATVQEIVTLSKNELLIQEKARQYDASPEGSKQKKNAKKVIEDLYDANFKIINSLDGKKLSEEAEKINNPEEVKGIEDSMSEFISEFDRDLEEIKREIGDVDIFELLTLDEIFERVESGIALKDIINEGKKEGDEGYVFISKSASDKYEDLKNKRDEYNKIKRNQERIEQHRKAPAGKTNYEKIARQISEKLITNIINDQNQYFKSNEEKTDAVLKYLQEITEQDLSTFHKGLIKELYGNITRDSDIEIGLDKFYDSLVAADEILFEIQRFNPSSDKIIPRTTLEAGFTGFKTDKAGGIANLLNMANVNHVIFMLLKNDRMSTPLRNLSAKIDADFSGMISRNEADENSFFSGDFLDGKVSEERLSKLFSEASINEMMILSHVGKVPEGTTPQRHFFNVKNFLFQNKEQLRRLDDSEFVGKVRQKAYSDAYDKLFSGAKTIGDVYANADKDVVSAVNRMAEIFKPVKEDALKRMRDYYGKEGTVFENYIPSFFSVIKDDSGRDKIRSDSESLVFGPSAMQETVQIDDISQSNKALVADNFVSMVFRAKLNLDAELGLRSDIDKMKGVINSKQFENLFDTTSKKIPFGKNSDFEFMRGLLNEKLNIIDSKIQSVGEAAYQDTDLVKDFVNTATKVITATRLSTVSMRLSQATSAMLSALMIVDGSSRRMLLKSLSNFMTGQLTAELQSNKDFYEVLSKSSTSRRSGLEQKKPSAFFDKRKKRKASTAPKAVWDFTMDGLSKNSDKTLDITLGQSDKIAGHATWAAFYHSRVNQMRASEVKGMNYDQFWAWSKDNIDMDAVAWADQQVDRSQMLSNQWNNGKAFSGKILSNILFPFGRFAYNRKVGMANDWSIINDKSKATEADKAKAWRRLTSAVVEIGVFKAIQPAVGIMVAKSFAGLLSGLVGFDDEYDRAVEIVNKSLSYINPLKDDVKLSKFQVSNYKRDLGKEFYTAMFEGMIPLATPSAVNELLMAALNDASGEDMFNVYSKDIRDLFTEGDETLSTDDVIEIITKNMGIVSMGLDDGIALSNALTKETGRLPNPFGGDDRWVIPEAMKAAEVLKYGRIVNVFIQSADLKKFLNTTERLLQRKYTTTNRPNYEAYKKEKQQEIGDFGVKPFDKQKEEE